VGFRAVVDLADLAAEVLAAAAPAEVGDPVETQYFASLRGRNILRLYTYPINGFTTPAAGIDEASTQRCRSLAR
jgi:hypothetical protein